MLSSIIEEIQQLIQKTNYPSDDLKQIEEDFKRMVDFFAAGYYDPDIDKVYKNLRSRAIRLKEQIKMYQYRQTHPFFKQMEQDVCGNFTLDIHELRNHLEDFVIDLTMLDLETSPEAAIQARKAIYTKHHKYRKIMFAQIVLAPRFTQDDTQAIQSLILSSSIDPIDAQLIVTAIMLSCTTLFDQNKANILYHVHKKSSDETLSQRALISYLLATTVPEATTVPDPATVPEASASGFVHPVDPSLLTQVQQQILYTIDTPRVEHIMQHDIMPDIIKNSEFDFQNNRIVQREKNKLDDILNPHNEEEAIEKMEESIRKMKQLQDQGSDLFFSGFRHVKRNPFFNDIINWFCPFYFDHPQLPDIHNPDDKKIIHNLIARTPFCDSDKYSFIISMSQAISTIPDNLKQMMKNGDVQLDIVGASHVPHNAAYLRRTYLQDLFRFYSICTKATGLHNPITTPIILNYINHANPTYDQTAISILKTLTKFNLPDWTNHILTNWTPHTTEGKIFKAFQLISHNPANVPEASASGFATVPDAFPSGFATVPDAFQSGHAHPLEACKLFDDILTQDQHNIQALYGYTKLAFTHPVARKTWHPHQTAALKALLALYFKNESDKNVLLTLCKAYIMLQDHHNAEKYCREAIARQPSEPFPYIYLAYRNIQEKRVKEALTLFKQSGQQPGDIITTAKAFPIKLTEAETDILYTALSL